MCSRNMDPVSKNALGLKFSQAIRAHCKPLYLSCFLILRLGAPTGILRGGSTVFKRFGPLNLLTFSGGRAASGDQPDVPVGFSLSFGTQRLPPAMRGSLWPSYAGHCCLDWSDFRKLSMASSCRILPAFGLQSSTMRGSLWPFYVDRIHPSCLQRSWKLSVAFSHRVLNICKLGLKISL